MEGSSSSTNCGATFPRGTGLLLVGHGTREAVGIEEFLQTAAQVAERAGEAPVEPCFLEFAQPTIADGFRRLVERGATRVIVTPVLLFAAGHAKRDIPHEVQLAASQWPHIEVSQAEHLGCHEALLKLSERRFAEALQGRDNDEEQTIVVLVGRGSHDPDATAEMFAFANERAALAANERLKIEVGFVAMAAPRYSDLLEVAAASPATRVVIQPHLLFGGVLLDRLSQAAADYAARFPRKQWIATAHLGPDPLVANAILARAAELLSAQVSKQASVTRQES